MKFKLFMQKIEYSRVYCIVIMAAVSIALYCMTNIGELYDAGDYWTRGQLLWANGKFSFLNIDGFRGYIYPLYLGICGRAGKYGFVIINSLAVSAWFAYCMPKLHMCRLQERSVFRKNMECIVCFFLFMLFFRGLVIYSLSDLFAIILCSFSVLLECKIKESSGVKKVIGGFLLGITLYLAYNVRTIYLFAGIWLSAKLLIHLMTYPQKLAEKINVLIFIVIGTITASIPQIFMNFHMLGKISLAVPTQGLMLKQVSWGVKFQRYDTYVGNIVGNDVLHPQPQVYFVDPAGNALMQNMGIAEFGNWGEFLKFAVSHPLDLIGIYVRHMVNVLFPCWPNQYVLNLNNYKVIYAFTAVLVFFLFGTALLNHFMDKAFLKMYGGLIVPAVFILAGAVEVRYFVALYLMGIGGICFNLDWGGQKISIGKQRKNFIFADFIRRSADFHVGQHAGE